jgi:cell wall-associated NlpC family hydrolase
MRRFGLIALAITSALAVAPGAPPAGADPISDAQAQAQALQSQIEANNQRIDALSQRYDGAQLRLQQAEQAVTDAEAKQAAAQRSLDALRARVRERAGSDYRGAVSGQSLSALDFRDSEQLLIGEKYTSAQAAADQALIAQLGVVKQRLTGDQAAAERAKAQAEAERQQIAGARQSLAAANAAQQQTLSQVQGQLVALVQQEQQRREAAALAAAQSRFGGGGNADPAAFPNVAAPNGAAAQAIAFARAQLGKPYEYAAAGPNSYDCSGLVMAAYASAGVRLPHYSGAQYDMLPHVPFGAMQAGDLLFWGAGGSEHVAIYIGSARILEAGGTGNDVHIGPIWGQPVGAARP